MSEEEESDDSGLFQDSFTIGTAAKLGAIKVYFDATKIDETQKKIDNALKIRQYLIGLGLMQ